jgi:hypothetical protein
MMSSSFAGNCALLAEEDGFYSSREPISLVTISLVGCLKPDSSGDFSVDTRPVLFDKCWESSCSAVYLEDSTGDAFLRAFVYVITFKPNGTGVFVALLRFPSNDSRLDSRVPLLWSGRSDKSTDTYFSYS